MSKKLALRPDRMTMAKKNKAETAVQQMIEFAPDDNSGSSSSNRYAYQKNWALYKMLELEQLGRDYMIVMDYHDDVVIIDTSIEGDNIDFYQVKTKKENYWRPNELISSTTDEKGGIKHSILGKLLKHSIDFSKAKDYYFVTDSFLSPGSIVKGNDYDSAKIPFIKLKDEIQKSIKEKIKKELSTIEDDVWKHFYISQQQLSTDNYKNTLIGLIQRFIDKRLPKAEISSSTLYDSLFSEIESVQDYEGNISDEAVLSVRKSFKHSDFKVYIEKLATFNSYDSKCNKVIDKFLPLAGDEMNFVREVRFKQILTSKIKTLLYDYNNAEFLQLTSFITRMVSDFNDSELTGYANSNQWEISKLLLGRLKEGYMMKMDLQDDDLQALILLEYA
jgi:hypothetical protein